MTERALTPLTKNARQQLITDLLGSREVHSQAELAELPRRQGTARHPGDVEP